MPTTSAYATVFAVAFGITLVLTPIAGRIARSLGALAEPDERKVHKIPTPYLGGAAMFLGFGGALLAASRMDAFAAVFESSTAPLGVALGAFIACVVGTAAISLRVCGAVER